MSQCEECRIGRLHAKRITFVDWMGDLAIVVPNAPAQVCDVCGDAHYDVEFLDRLQHLVESTPEDAARALRFPTQPPASKRRWQQL